MANRDTTSGQRAAEIARTVHGLLSEKRLLGKAAEAAGVDRKYFSEVLGRANGIHLGPLLAALELLEIHPASFLLEHFPTSLSEFNLGAVGSGEAWSDV